MERSMDLQYLAKEYQKLQKDNYVLGIDNGETLNISFTNRDFYHLLGFQKFKKDVTVVKMIEDGAYYKDNFYQNVLKGNITWDEIKIPIKNIETYMAEGKVVQFSEAVVNNEVGRVINNRFPFFTAENVKFMMFSELVILYDKAKGLEWNKVDADRIFFRFFTERDRNLYFFVKCIEDKLEDCPVTFFLEEVKDSYIKTNAYCEEREQAKANIVFGAVIDKEINHMREFYVDWKKVRFKYSKNCLSEFKGQKRLAKFFSNQEVIRYSTCNKAEADAIKRKNDIVKELDEKTKRIYLLEQYNLYQNEKDEIKRLDIAIDVLDKFEINFENTEFEEESAQIDVYRTCEESLKKEISKLNKKIAEIRKYKEIIRELEKKEIIYVYKQFVSDIEAYEEDFFELLIEKYNIFETLIFPNGIKCYYDDFKSKNLF